MFYIFLILFLETAINIGYSCQLLTDDMIDVFVVDGITKLEVETQLKKFRESIKIVNTYQPNCKFEHLIIWIFVLMFILRTKVLESARSLIFNLFLLSVFSSHRKWFPSKCQFSFIITWIYGCKCKIPTSNFSGHV